METTARTHSQKIARLLSQLEEAQTTTVQSEDEITRLQGVLAEQHRKVAELEDSLRSVDQERDRLQALLDGEQEGSARRDAQRQAQLNELAQLRQLLERSEKRTASVAGELTANQRQGAALEARVTSLKEENLELKRRVGMKSKEAGGAAEDLMLMTRENQVGKTKKSNHICELYLDCIVEHNSSAIQNLRMLIFNLFHHFPSILF